jgi:DnaJ homolog subfamily C member 28
MSEQKDSKEQQQSAKQTPARRNLEGYLDEIISKAYADGLMDNLPGQGKPLNLGDDEMVPEENRLGFRMLKSNGFAPPWIEARREIDTERDRLDTWLKDANRRWPYLQPSAQTGLRIAYKRKLDDLGRLILNYNLKAPSSVPHIEGLRMSEELAKLGG